MTLTSTFLHPFLHFIRYFLEHIYKKVNRPLPYHLWEQNQKLIREERVPFFIRTSYLWLRLSCSYFWTRFWPAFNLDPPWTICINASCDLSSLRFPDQFASSMNIIQNIKSEAGCSYKSCSYKKECIINWLEVHH